MVMADMTREIQELKEAFAQKEWEVSLKDRQNLREWESIKVLRMLKNLDLDLYSVTFQDQDINQAVFDILTDELKTKENISSITFKDCTFSTDFLSLQNENDQLTLITFTGHNMTDD